MCPGPQLKKKGEFFRGHFDNFIRSRLKVNVQEKAMKKKAAIVHAPETIEGWFALHQVFRVTGTGRDENGEIIFGISTDRRDPYPDGWSGIAGLIGSHGHFLTMHFFPTLDRIAQAQAEIDEMGKFANWGLELVYSFL